MSHRATTRKRGQQRRRGGSARYRVELSDGKLAVRPMTDEEKRAYNELTPEEKVQRFVEWANQPRPETPILPDEAFRRENLYD